MRELEKKPLVTLIKACGSKDTASANTPFCGVFFRLKTTSSHIILALSSNLAVSFCLIQSHLPMWEPMANDVGI